MKIIQVIPAISEEASGGTYAVTNLCRYLEGQVDQMSLVTLKWNDVKFPPRYHREFELGFGIRRLGLSPKMNNWLNLQARNGTVDIIHNHSLWMMPNIYSGMVAKKFNIPLLVSPHGTLSKTAMYSGSFIKRFFWPLIQRPALSTVNCFHATAESEYLDIRRMGFREPVAIIPNGIDFQLSPKMLRGGTQTLLFLGRIHPIKGLDMLLAAWKLVEDRFPNWNLQIAGPDQARYLQEMQALSLSLGNERVTFLGPLYGEQKKAAYLNASLFVLPSYSENFGISIAEALSFGLPVIATKACPWQGLIQQNAGWWTDIGVDSLAYCLNEALSKSPGQLIEMGSRGRAWMQNDFSWSESAHKMLETYKWMINKDVAPDWVIED